MSALARRSAPFAVLLVVGLIGLSTLAARPRFQAYHTVDVLQLLASGMCFGVALAQVLPRRRGQS